MQSTSYRCQILMELEFSQQTFEKMLSYKISSKSSQWEPSCCIRTDGQADRYDEVNSRFSKFCERA